MAQLQKVIQIFNFQLEEKGMQRYFLNEKFDYLINEKLTQYSGKMDEINKANSDIYLDIVQNYHNNYSKQAEILKNSYDKHIEEVTNEIENYSDEVSHEITKIVSQLMNMQLDLNQNQAQSVNAIHHEAGFLEQKIIEIQQNAKTEMDKFDIEASNKHKRAEEEFALRVENMNKEHLFKMNAVKKEFGYNTDAEENFNQYLLTAKESLRDLSQLLLKLTNEIKDTNFISKQKEDAIDISKLVFDTKKQTEKVIEAFKDQMEKFKDLQNLEIKELKDKLNATRANNEFNLQKLRKQNQSDISSLENELQMEYAKIRASQTAVSSSFEKLMENNFAALQTLENNIRASEKMTESKLAALSAKLQKEMGEFDKETKMKEEELQKLMKNFESELEKNRIRLEKEKSDLIGRQTSLENQIRAEISRINSKLSQQRRSNEDLLKAQKLILAKVQKERKEQLEALSQSNLWKTKELNSSFAEEEELLKIKLNNDIHKIEKKFDDKIAQTLEKNRTERQRFAEDLSSKNEEELSKIKLKGFDKSEYSKEKEKYENEFEFLQSTLDSIKPPSGSDFGSADTQIGQLAEEKADLRRSISVERQNVEKEWDSAFEREKQRHISATPVPSGRNREQMKQSLLYQISEVIRIKNEEETALKETLKSIQDKFDEDLRMILLLKEKALDSGEVERLKNELTKEKEISKETLEEISNKATERITNLKNSINQMNEHFEFKADISRKQIEGLRCLFEGDLEQLKQSLALCGPEEEKDKGIESERFISAKRKLLCDFEVSRGRVLEEIKISKEELSKLSDKLLHQREASSIRAASSAGRCQRSNESDLERIKHEWAAMLEFYNEKIESLKEAIKQGQIKYDTRPARDCDLEKIDALTVQLQSRTMMLKSLMKDYTEYKKLIVAKEAEYNRNFGRKPHIGVLAFQ